MLLYLSLLTDYVGALNLFRYVTFRTMGAVLTALLVSFMLGKPFIKWLRTRQKEGQPIRLDGPESHLITKKGTPTMGGGLMLFSVSVSTLLWADLHNMYVWIALFVTLSFGGLGMRDDYLKLTKRTSDGVSGKTKLMVQVCVSLIAAVLYVRELGGESVSSMGDLVRMSTMTGIAVPFMKMQIIPLGIGFYMVSALVITGASNAVNLTDGLDGLAIVPVMIAGACFCLIAYLVGNARFADYLYLLHIPGASELCVFCAAFIGAGLGFLWFNAPPAQVFMGDTGSLAAGGALGAVAMMTKHELVLGIIGGLFVIEALSVIIQVFYYKRTKKRVFLMAPIHHHFEKKGWPESTIVVRFWIIASILAIIGLSTLKLR